MTIRRTLVGQPVERPSGAQIRKKIKQSKTIKGFRMRPGYVYTVVRAISARINQNYDGWPSDELKQSYHTFIGKPVFVNHTNEDPNTARGVVVAARYIENGNDKYVECVQEIDAQRYPKVAQEIITGGLDSVSMGAEAGFTICSYCNNRAIDEYDLCDHVKYHKGSTLRKFNQRTGKTEDVLIYESCHKLSFFELSYVFDPADETAVASKVLVANRKDAGATEDYLEWQRKVESGEITPEREFGPARGGGPSRAQQRWLDQTKRRLGFEEAVLKAAGIKLAKCHYCDSEAEEGFSSCSSHRAMEQNKFTKSSAMDCPPGADCGMDDPNDPNNFDPASATTTDSSSSSSSSSTSPGVGGALGGAGSSFSFSEGQSNRDFAHAQMKPYWEQQGFTVGDHAADAHGEHQNGALDIMVSDSADGDRIAQEALKDPNAYGVIWNNQIYGYGQGNDPRDYGSTGGPTDRHEDHVHVWYKNQSSPNPAAQPKSASFEVRVLQAAGFEDLDEFPEALRGYQQHRDNNYGGVDSWDSMQHYVDQANNAHGGFSGATEEKLWNYAKNRMNMPGFGPYGRDTQHPHGPYAPNDVPSEKYQVPPSMTPQQRLNSFEDRVLKVAYGEIEAPTEVDTLRGEGSATGDDTEDFHHYVESPDDLKGPDTSANAQLEREQAMGGDEQMGEPPPPQQPQQQYMTLQIPIPLQQEPPPPQLPMMPQPVQTATPLQGPVPGQQPGGGALPPAAQGVPPQPQQPPQQMAASFTARTASAAELAYFEDYFGHRIANWRDAIVANRPMTPEEGADYRRARGKFLVSSTLEKVASVSTTSRTSEKGSANMARSTLAERGKVASQGRRRHYAEGPLVDGGDRSRNDQGEQEEVFLTPTPPPEHTPLPDDDTHNISNTEGNLVAKVQRGREQLLKDAQALAALQQQKLGWDDDSDYFAPKDKYQRDRGRYNPSADEFDSDDEYDAFQRNRVAGVDGDADKVVNPTAPTPSAERLTGDHFEAVEEAPTPSTMTGAVNDNSLKIFQAFDQWLAKATGKASRDHDEATIKRGAAEFAKRAKFNPQEMFPALGIVLREARKNDTRKAAAMRKQTNESLAIAAPDERLDVEAPVAGVTDAKAQASQFDSGDFDHNSGKDKAKPDTSTDSQFWSPGEGNKGTKRRKPTGAQEKTAGALLGMRCAEAMIAAGLEPNDRERRYQLASEFQDMSRGAVLDRTALAERFVGVRQADRQHYQQQVASGNSRGAARSPIPPGLSQGVAARTASTHRSAANDPSNDSLLFG